MVNTKENNMTTDFSGKRIEIFSNEDIAKNTHKHY